MSDNLLNKLNTLKPHHIEFAITDYQGEGVKLEIFTWENDCELLEVNTISTGDYIRLYQQMVQLNTLCEQYGINTTYHPNLQFC